MVGFLIIPNTLSLIFLCAKVLALRAWALLDLRCVLGK
jgi:hypothetical protein